MASPQAHVLVWFLRRRFKRPLPDPVDIAAVRAAMERAGTGRIPRGIRVTSADGPVPGEWVVARRAPQDATPLLYLHGGGFIACSARTHRPVTTALARASRLPVFVPNYRLAPEHRFPAAIEDAVAAYDWLRAAAGRPVAAIVGDSAGGGLALSTLLRLRDTGRMLPLCAVAFSPVTDLAATGASVVLNDARDAMFFGASLARIARVYLPDGLDPRDALASPLYADLSRLPPLLLHVGAREVLRDDSVRFAERARAAGVAVTLKVWPVVPHAWQLMRVLPESRRSVRAAAAFIHRAIGEDRHARALAARGGAGL